MQICIDEKMHIQSITPYPAVPPGELSCFSFGLKSRPWQAVHFVPFRHSGVVVQKETPASAKVKNGCIPQPSHTPFCRYLPARSRSVFNCGIQCWLAIVNGGHQLANSKHVTLQLFQRRNTTACANSNFQFVITSHFTT
jgi:hypothetical protein